MEINNQKKTNNSNINNNNSQEKDLMRFGHTVCLSNIKDY